jgi:hypothetical protein
VAAWTSGIGEASDWKSDGTTGKPSIEVEAVTSDAPSPRSPFCASSSRRGSRCPSPPERGRIVFEREAGTRATWQASQSIRDCTSRMRDRHCAPWEGRMTGLGGPDEKNKRTHLASRHVAPHHIESSVRMRPTMRTYHPPQSTRSPPLGRDRYPSLVSPRERVPPNSVRQRGRGAPIRRCRG